LLSTCASEKWPEVVATLSIVVVSYAACLLAGLTAIMWLETGSIFQPGGRRQALWDRFAQSSRDGRDHAIVSVRRRLSNAAGFSAAIVPETATAHSADRVVSVETSAAAAAGAACE
jgi:hypothetical protein